MISPLRQACRAIIRPGLEAWLDLRFQSGHPVYDPITGYELTRSCACISYRTHVGYHAIEDTFIKSVGEQRTVTPALIQQWTNYFWTYAELEAVEDYRTDEQKAAV